MNTIFSWFDRIDNSVFAWIRVLAGSVIVVAILYSDSFEIGWLVAIIAFLLLGFCETVTRSYSKRGPECITAMKKNRNIQALIMISILTAVAVFSTTTEYLIVNSIVYIAFIVIIFGNLSYKEKQL